MNNETTSSPSQSAPIFEMPKMPELPSMPAILPASIPVLEGSSEFLNSNSMVAKFAFIILVLIFFVIFLRSGISFLSWLFSPTPNPILLDGMANAKQMIQIPQDPTANGAIPILRSINEKEGLGFTWSVWIYIDDMTYKENEYKHIFHKGNDNINTKIAPYGMNFPNNAPGLYLAPMKNDLVVVMNTFSEINEQVTVKDVPLNKWVNVIMRVNEQRELDIYINGKLARRHILSSVPRQNYGDVFVTMNGGFSGFVSSLRYFSSSIGVNDIQNILTDGPNLKTVGDSMINSQPNYLSMRWFFENNTN
jgi:hypothetical protein